MARSWAPKCILKLLLTGWLVKNQPQCSVKVCPKKELLAYGDHLPGLYPMPYTHTRVNLALNKTNIIIVSIIMRLLATCELTDVRHVVRVPRFMFILQLNTQYLESNQLLKTNTWTTRWYKWRAFSLCTRWANYTQENLTLHNQSCKKSKSHQSSKTSLKTLK